MAPAMPDDRKNRILGDHTVICPRCGFDLEDVVRRGRVGCPECYGAFEAIVRELLAKTMPHPTHSGKRPAAWRNGRPPAPLGGIEPGTV